MVDPNQGNKLSRRASALLFAGFAAVILLFVVSGAVAYFNTRTLRDDAAQIAHTHEVLAALDEVASLAKDAETGQRGFVITGEESYLEPYTMAVGQIYGRLSKAEELAQDHPELLVYFPDLTSAIDVKFNELAESINLRRADGFEAARAAITTDQGKSSMDTIRRLIDTMQQEERALRRVRIAEMERAYSVAVGSGIATGILGALLSAAVALLLRQAIISRFRQDWLQAGQIKVTEVLSGEQSLELLAENVLKFFGSYLQAQTGAFFARGGNEFRRVATYGVPADSNTPERFRPGDGLLGQAARDARTFVLRDVPEGYLTVGSAFGQSKPRHLVVLPIVEDGRVNAVLELGFLQELHDNATELFERTSESIGVAVRSVNYRLHLQNLLEETQRQAEELQAQGEELRVSNEELEEQGRALRESQNRLENQHAELEQTNAQLEEQTQLLEAQRDELSRAKESVELQAREIEQASRYKSDFLANMSHELRTPLNSSLILAKLLADNADGNLTAEQVQYAETIQTSGNDLLTLINDILDLSKIEAGHMEIRPEPVRITQLIGDLARTFQPVAGQRQLELRTKVEPGTPEVIETDRQRLEQILKNLLSNALKFTEQGSVDLNVRRASADRVAFAVADTGIGIPAPQQKVIFDAFRQADGTTNRKYGGTGLGLSISRELTRLLGGEIRLVSQQGSGSTFTVTIPERYQPIAAPLPAPPLASPSVGAVESPSVISRAAPLFRPISAGLAASATAPLRSRLFDDDRDRLDGSRHLLVVEDDESFARILYDLAHELDFQCLIANSAEEGFATALQFMPNAVVLDVGLPDHSGLWVLDRLKHDRRTRHIPVHVISAGDYAQTALALGAVGYMLKPVKREDLEDALKQLESRLLQRLGRVLVVEDDLVQLDSLRKLLGSQDVETVGASTAAECLERLKHSTFDCMVLDLSLPDASGYTLLETLSREDAYSFPPVIVYTGRDLSADEEQRLRRYSKSIIIKGAKSPERLLDEITLFLHQVVSDLPAEQQHMLERARHRDAAIEGRRILVVEDDVRNVFALTSILEPRGAVVQIARNGREALSTLEATLQGGAPAVDLVLLDVMMPEMDGITTMREIRKRSAWRKLPVIMLTAKAMKDDQENCLAAGANDYMAKPLDVEKLLSLVRVWMPR